MKTSTFSILLSLSLAFGLLFSPSGTAQAAVCGTSYTVSSAADSGPGTLREGAAIVCPDGTILFDSALNGQTISLVSPIIFDKNLTITGPGAANLSISGGGAVRIFDNNGGFTLTISGLRFVNGLATAGAALFNTGTVSLDASTFSANTSNGTSFPQDGGGAIWNSGTLTITNSTFSGNTHNANGHGGGAILNLGTMTIKKSVFENNTANGNGGGAIAEGVYFSTPLLDVDESTFRSNSAYGDYGDGGALNINGDISVLRSLFSNNSAASNDGFGYGQGGAVSIINANASSFTNVTFSTNSATLNGGAIYYRNDNLSLQNVTLVYNRADSDNNSKGDGGSLYSDTTFFSSPAPQVSNSILAGNFAANGADCAGEVDFQGYNLLQTPAGCTNVGISTGDLTGISPSLGPLADNGGATFTHALLSGSPAINAASNTSCPSTDQRGISRPQQGTCDMGAYEYQSFPAVTSTSLLSAYSVGPANFTVTFSEAVDDQAGNSATDDVTNPANYLLLEKGANAAADTASCAAGLSGDDVQKTVTAVSYTPATLTSLVTLSGALPNGKYRLLVCGTTSIVGVGGGAPLNNGSDTAIDFSVQAAASVSSNPLPNTGFAPEQKSVLPAQPASSAYAAYDNLTLTIAALGVQAPIAGVRQTSSGWDVSWLGNSVGWLEGSAFPTWAGNTVLTGHVWNANNTPGVFANLKNLRYGDTLEISAFGRSYTYAVRENTLLWGWDSAKSAFRHEEQDWVTLLTCEGYNPLSGGYFFRRMVRAVLTGVK